MWTIAKCWNICWIICPRLRNLHGRPTCYSQKLHADKRHNFPLCRQACTMRYIEHRIARRGWRVPHILENTAGLSSEPLPGSINIDVCPFDMNAGLISIWPFSPWLPLWSPFRGAFTTVDICQNHNRIVPVPLKSSLRNILYYNEGRSPVWYWNWKFYFYETF